MPFIIENLSMRPVLLRLNTGQTLHLDPQGTSKYLWDVEVMGSKMAEKLKDRHVIALHEVTGTFQVFKGKSGKFYFHLLDRDGEKVLLSQGYKSRSGCKKGILSVRRNAPSDENYQEEIAKGGMFYFRLNAVNKLVIGTSAMYSTKEELISGVELVKYVAPVANIEEPV